MITALQMARHKTVQHLIDAREALLETRSTICFEDGALHAHQITKIAVAIDDVIAKLVPNEPVKMEKF